LKTARYTPASIQVADIPTIITVQKARLILDDWISSDIEIQKKIDFLASMCRQIIRDELQLNKYE
jgi:hypothetical protein